MPIFWPPPRVHTGYTFGSWDDACEEVRRHWEWRDYRRPLLRRRHNAWEVWL